MGEISTIYRLCTHWYTYIIVVYLLIVVMRSIVHTMKVAGLMDVCVVCVIVCTTDSDRISWLLDPFYVLIAYYSIVLLLYIVYRLPRPTTVDFQFLEFYYYFPKDFLCQMYAYMSVWVSVTQYIRLKSVHAFVYLWVLCNSFSFIDMFLFICAFLEKQMAIEMKKIKWKSWWYPLIYKIQCCCRLLVWPLVWAPQYWWNFIACVLNENN